MSDRIYFKDGARITEEMLNDSFGFLEESHLRLVTSIGVRGIIHGLSVGPQPVPDMSVVLGSGLGFDGQGQRIVVDDAQTIDCTQERGGMPTGVVMPGHERWVALSVRFARRDGKPFLDKNNRVVATCSVESFAVVARNGGEGPEGHAQRPPLDPAELHVCDVRLRHGQTAVVQEDIDNARRQPFTLTHASTVGADGADWKILAAATSVQRALDNVDRALAAQCAALRELVRGDAWRTLPNSRSVQAALDAVDSALTQHASALDNLVHGTHWKSVPDATSTQEALDGVDALITEQRHTLQAMHERLETLGQPAEPRPDANRVGGMFVYEKSVDVPPLGPLQSWVQATRAESIKATDRIASIVSAPCVDPQILVRPVTCIDGALRLQFTNLSAVALEPTRCDFTVYVVESAMVPARH